MEKQKLIYVESKALFSPSEVSDKAIVFIEDTKEIWTHGVYFSCSGTWATPITLSLTGDTTGSVSIDGSGNASIATTTLRLSASSYPTDANNAASTAYHNISYYRVNSNTSNLFPVANNANAILSLNVHDYSYTHLLGFSSNGNIYHRRRSAGTWETSWKAILNSSNYTNFLDSVYLKKSGGTMTGILTLTTGSAYINDTASGYSIYGSMEASNTSIGTSGLATIFSGAPSLNMVLRTSGDNLYHYNHSKSARYLILDTNNYSTYALPLSGGTMKGALNFANNTWNKVGDDAYMGDCDVAGMIGIKGSNAATPGFAMYNNSGTLLGKLYASGSDLYWSNAKLLTSADSIGEAYLAWGGRNLANNPGPIDAALAPSLGANRLAFLNPDAIDIEYSLDGGTTWVDYGVTDAQKVLLFDGNHLVDLYLGGDNTQDTSIDRTSWRLRITLSAIGYNLYGEFKKFMIRVTSHGNILRCTLLGRSYSNVQNDIDTWATFLDTLLSGWPGWNTINHPAGIIIPSTNYYGQIRFDFYMAALGSFGVPSHIHKIMGFAPTCWTWPSIMAGYGSIYSYDWQLNATFPAKVTATGGFSGNLTGNVTGNLTGNASTASKWKDARTITLTGDVTGSVTLDGSSNVTLTTATTGTGTTSFLKCPDKRNSYPALIVTSGGNIGAAFISTSTLGLSEGYYCDTLILRGYATHTAGYENALLFNKQNSSVYHSQYAFGSTTTWGTMYKFLDSSNYSSYALPLSGGTLTDTLILKAGAFTASNSNSYSGGRYQAVAKPNIRLIGDSTYGLSTIEFISLKGDTSINKPSDSGFIQFQPYGVSALSSVGSHPTLKTSGETNALVLGVTNDTDDIIVLQSPNVSGLRHACGTTEYYLPHVTTSTTTANKPLVSTTTAHVYTLGAECLPLSGGTMTGKITLWSSNADAANTGGLNANNSNIYGLNSLYFADASETAAEGINFYRSSTTVDSLWGSNGNLYWTPNRTYGSAGTSYYVLTSNNYSIHLNNTYLPLSGGTMTGKLKLTTNTSWIADSATSAIILGTFASGNSSEGLSSEAGVLIGSLSTLTTLRSNGDDLWHYRNSDKKRHKILDAANYTNYTINYAKSGINNAGYAGIISDGKLYYNNKLSFAVFVPDDNLGKVSYELIAELPNYNTGANTGYINYGISGFMWSYRGGNCNNSSAYPITAIVSIGKGTYSHIRIPVTTDVLVPFIVKYNDKYYLALRKQSTSTAFYFMGQKLNLLTTTIKVTDPSLIEEIKGPETETSTSKFYYNNGNPQEYLHAGNYNYYALPLAGGTLTGILKSTLTAGTALGTSPIVFTGNAASSTSINTSYSHLASNLTTGGALLIFLGKAGSNYNGGSIGYWHKGGDGSSGNALTFGLFAANNLMVILGNGNVGINNTSPSYKLDVGGDIYSSGYVRAKSGFIKTDSSDSYVLLGGGGHKLLSDFVLTSSLNNYVTLSTNLTVSGKKLFNNQLIIRKDVGDTDSKVIDIQHDLQLQVRRDSNTHSVAIGVMPTGAGVIWAKANGIGYNTLYLNPYNNGVAIGCGGNGALPNLNDGYYFHIFGSTLSNNSITATKFIKSGGTSSLFLKADGSLDSTSYLKVDGTNGTADGVSTLLNKLTTGSSTPTDADYYICQWAGGGTTTTSYVRRPVSALYTYIKSKLSLNPDERFIYATSATSNQYGTTEATGSSTTLTRTLFWRDNDRALIGMYVQHSDSLNYGFELASSYGTDALTYKRKFNGTWETIQTVLTSSNYNNYSPTLTGTGASGTWAINISGVAASASKVANALTIQLNGGTTAGTNKFVYDGSSAYTINITPEAIGASATNHTHSYLPLSGGTLGNTSATETELRLKSSTATLRLVAYLNTFNYIQSGNADFNGSTPLQITGYNGTVGSDLYLKFTNIYCRAGNYTNIDSGNYSSYALPLSGGTLTDTLISRDIRPSANLSYSLGTSSYYYNYVYANYFKKNGSSDSYVLLGGGGHKAVSDFAPNNVATLSSSGMGNSDLWTLVFDKSYPDYWYSPTTMFYIRSASAGCGILCFYNYWASGTQLDDYEKEVWFFGAGKSETGITFGGSNRDINDYFRIYIDKANCKYCMYYNRYNNLSLQILELLFFTVPEPGEYLSTGSLRSSFFTNSNTVVDLPTESSTLVRVPIKTTYNHDRTIRTTKSIYASSFYENSDIRLKENVRGIDLSDLTKLVDLVQFNFKDSGTKKYGVIAQLLELVGLQNLVYENNGNKAVDYISLLVLEIQRLRNEIGELKLEINKKS